MPLKRPVDVGAAPLDELGAWLALCEALGIVVEQRGAGLYNVIAPTGVLVPEPPPWR